jgi:hypothetical protein
LGIGRPARRSANAAIELTRYQAGQDLEERDRLDDEFRSQMDRLFPKFREIHDAYVRARGRTEGGPRP